MDREIAQLRLLDAAEELFYGRGIQSVGMDDIRAASGVSLKRVYQLYPAKDQLIQAYLDRRDRRWRAQLAEYVQTQEARPVARLLAVFDWLRGWFGEPDFRGCAWVNGYGELGAVSSAVAELARMHKEAFRSYLRDLVADAGLPGELSDATYLLAEGAMVTAGIFHTVEPAEQAKRAASVLIHEALRAGPPPPGGSARPPSVPAESTS